MVIRKFGEDQSKTQPVGLFSPQNVLVVVTTLCLSKPPLITNHNYVNIYVSKTSAQTTSCSFSLLLFESRRPKHLG